MRKIPLVPALFGAVVGSFGGAVFGGNAIQNLYSQDLQFCVESIKTTQKELKDRSRETHACLNELLAEKKDHIICMQNSVQKTQVYNDLYLECNNVLEQRDSLTQEVTVLRQESFACQRELGIALSGQITLLEKVLLEKEARSQLLQEQAECNALRLKDDDRESRFTLRQKEPNAFLEKEKMGAGGGKRISMK